MNVGLTRDRDHGQFLSFRLLLKAQTGCRTNGRCVIRVRIGDLSHRKVCDMRREKRLFPILGVIWKIVYVSQVRSGGYTVHFYPGADVIMTSLLARTIWVCEKALRTELKKIMRGGRRKPWEESSFALLFVFFFCQENQIPEGDDLDALRSHIFLVADILGVPSHWEILRLGGVPSSRFVAHCRHTNRGV